MPGGLQEQLSPQHVDLGLEPIAALTAMSPVLPFPHWQAWRLIHWLQQIPALCPLLQVWPTQDHTAVSTSILHRAEDMFLKIISVEEFLNMFYG
jgi:hypothetical protein